MGKGSGDQNCQAILSATVILDLPRHGQVEIIPGVLDQKAKFVFSAGHCHSMALALHRHTGWPILALSGRYSIRPDLQHMVVVMPDGRWLDVKGPAQPEPELYLNMQPMQPAQILALEGLGDWNDPQEMIAAQFVRALLQEHGIS